MGLFFTLSGFLITNYLLRNSSVVVFILRRFFRVVPLAWLYLAIALSFMREDAHFYLANFLFYANWPPMWLDAANGHMWSLCVEVQFYSGMALLVVLLRRYWFYCIPIICVAVTIRRAVDGLAFAINTYYRADELLAGAWLALIYNNRFRGIGMRVFRANMQLPLLALLIVSCHPEGGFLTYVRPYIAALLVGSTLVNDKTRLATALHSRHLFYLATVSYALYIIHPLLAETWLGSGEGIEKYAKRPLLFALLFVLAHLSTFYYEKTWIAFGTALCEKWQRHLALR